LYIDLVLAANGLSPVLWLPHHFLQDPGTKSQAESGNPMYVLVVKPLTPVTLICTVSLAPSGNMCGNMASHPYSPEHGLLLIHKVASSSPSARMIRAAFTSTSPR